MQRLLLAASAVVAAGQEAVGPSTCIESYSRCVPSSADPSTNVNMRCIGLIWWPLLLWGLHRRHRAFPAVKDHSVDTRPVLQARLAKSLQSSQCRDILLRHVRRVGCAMHIGTRRFAHVRLAMRIDWLP